jgi:hypothetical protein
MLSQIVEQVKELFKLLPEAVRIPFVIVGGSALGLAIVKISDAILQTNFGA